MYFYQGMHSNKKSSILIYYGTVTCLVILKSKSTPPMQSIAEKRRVLNLPHE